MRIGINGSTQVVVGADSATICRHAAEAEEQGFSSYWVNQSVVPDALTLLGAVGAATSSIELGTAVIPTWTRHPLMLAGQALTTQELTGGRLILGIGLAHKPSIEDTYEIPFARPAANMAQYLDVLLPALHDRAVDTSGDIWSAHVENVGGPAGVDSPSVMLAAMGPRMLDMAGGRTDGTILWLSGPRTIAERLAPPLRAAAEAAGRSEPRIVASVPVCVTDRADEVKATIEALLGRYDQLPSYRSVMDFEGAASVADVSAVGTEDEVREHIERFADAGASDFSAVEFTLADDEVERTRDVLREIAEHV